jgi:PAS domain S-box-containing protein
MATPLSFTASQVNRLFPFYILINKDLRVIGLGESISKLLEKEHIDQFNHFFAILRPDTSIHVFDDLVALHNQLVILKSGTSNKLLLRGQFEYFNETQEVLFIGSPWFSYKEQVAETELLIDDFAKHDPLVDLLPALKSKEITNDDLKELISTISRQKNELKKADKEAYDIALFTTQNPDPLIRINFNGDVLSNNPAAAKFDFFEYEKKIYRNDEFFKIVASQINKEKLRWIIEAGSDQRDYSFVCVSMPAEGYINIYGRDITHQKANQQQIERLSLVASANENAVVFTDDSGKIFWCNNGIEKITGYPQSEIIGKTPIELLRGPLTDSEVLKEMVNDYINGRSFKNELIQYRKDGSWYWGKTRAQSVITSDGKLSYFSIIEDITADKNSKDQLKILSSIAEENTHGVVIADAEGRVEWLNKSFEKITGYALSEMKGKKPGHILQGPETSKETVQYLKSQIEKGEPFLCEILNYHKNGSTYWLRLQGQPLKDEKGKVKKFFAIEEDITREKQISKQLKEFEARFRLALDRIGDNVWEHDFRTGKTRFSKYENGFLKLKPGDEDKIDKIWWSHIYKDDLHLIIANDKLYRNGEIDHHNMEYRLLQGDGSIKWVLDRGVVIERDNNGIPALIIGTHTDITVQKKIEQELKIAKDSAETSKKAKEVFLANMSHEIRTPMNAIIGMGNQLAKTKLSEQQNFYLATINTAAENLLVIINDILDLSKIEAGKLSVEKIGFEHKKVVGNAMQVLMHKAEEKGLALTNSFCDSRLSSVLIGDPYRLNQVLLNLISNAIKFTEKGSVDITCEIIEETATTQTIQTKVTDTGIGMETEFIEKLFDKFSQEYESVSRKFGGTGLGMSICKELIGLMGGRIEVSSIKGKGTIIFFSIEFGKGTIADIPGNLAQNITSGFLNGKTILVVDDNNMNRLVASTILKNYDATVSDAANGEEAIITLNKSKIDLILMDIQMPVLNGYDATRIIRSQGNKIPIIALTANAIKGENGKCIEAGMNDYIAKPFKEEEFLEKIAYWLNAEIKPAIY